MKTVLITGAGRGIGKAAALHFASNGWKVYAGVRSDEVGERLKSVHAEIEPVILDVTDQAQIDALPNVLPAQLDAVVNNAGVAVHGPVESLTREKLGWQMDVNVLGPVAVTRAVLPLIRAAKGRIVIVSSVSGRIATPWSGAYNGSKFAIEGIADAMRMELRPWGIRVSLVEPSATETDMWGEILNDFDSAVDDMTDNERTLYAKNIKGMRRTLGTMQKTTVPVEHVVKRIESALTAKRPRARYPVGFPSRMQLVLSAITPGPIEDWVVSRATGIPRRA